MVHFLRQCEVDVEGPLALVKDRDEGEDLNKPFDGANDGASGVGVLLEIARQVAMTDPAIGIDFILFDLEDYGNSDVDDSWCKVTASHFYDFKKIRS